MTTDTKAISLKDSDRLQAPPISAISPEQLDLIKRTVASGASDDELQLFLYDCQRQGTHPLDRLIHFSKRGGKYTPITSIDFMRMRAEATGELAGNDEPEYVFRDDETVIPYSASVTVWRIVQGQRYPFKATARWSEYLPPKGQDFMWMKMPHLMLGKCAEALALRKAFPKQLHGLYERAEMAQAGKEDSEPTREAEKVRAGAAPSTIGSDRPSAQPPREPIPDDAAIETESRQLFEPPDEAEERSQLIKQANKLIRDRKLGKRAIALVKKNFLGDEEADVFKADIAALNAVVKHLEVVTP